MRTRTDGFTLVELMVVVLIVGILVAIAVPVFNAAKANAEKSTCFANQRMMEGVYEQYVATVGTAPSYYEDMDFVRAGWLKKKPECPLWSADTLHHYTTTSHHYYFFATLTPGQVRTYRPNEANSDYVSVLGCPESGHGYYRTPGVN